VNAPVPFDASDLAATVERARGLLDDGDVIAARMLAGGAYDAAKAAAAFGSRFGAAERLVEKARRLQGDALLIEARAKMRLADDWDAAQAAGEATTKGRPKNVPDREQYSAEEAGLSRKEIHEARKLRDAERDRPGIVERAIAARLLAGLEPSRANLRATVGTRSHTSEERGDNLYETPPEAMRALLSLTRFAPTVWEPACGKGAISRMLEEAGYDVILSDLRDYGTANRHGECQEVGNFLDTGRRGGKASGITGAWKGVLAASEHVDIVTNPPYGTDLNAFVAHALRVHRPRRMALLLNLNFLCGFDDPDRCYAMDECPPTTVYVFTRRLPMMHRDGWTGPHAASSMNTAWFVWDLAGDGDTATYVLPNRPTELVRVDWKTFENSRPCGPRSGGAEMLDVPIPGLPALRWDQPHENGRIVAKLGSIDVGAIFPGNDDPKKTTWAFWLGVDRMSPKQQRRSRSMRPKRRSSSG
jgi:hypothetical protein